MSGLGKHIKTPFLEHGTHLLFRLTTFNKGGGNTPLWLNEDDDAENHIS